MYIAKVFHSQNKVEQILYLIFTAQDPESPGGAEQGEG